MRTKQLFGYVLLAVAAGFALKKIGQSGLLEHLEHDWFSFIGFLLVVGLLALAVVRVLRD